MSIQTFINVAGVATGELNVPLLVIIFGSMAIIAILLWLPSKEMKALAEKEKKSGLALKVEEEPAKEEKPIEMKEAEADKDQMSLVELKVAKHASAEDMSKEELRKLRRERRADAQTEKAKQERSEEKSEAEEKAVEKAEVLEAVSTVKEIETEAGEATKEAEKAEEKAGDAIERESEASEQEDVLEEKEEGMTFAQGLLSGSAIMEDASADSNDLLASLFGKVSSETDSSDLSFDAVSEELAGPAFPSLGSKLIPLNELTKAACEDESSKEEDDIFGSLTKRLASDTAEKKTLS